MTVNPTYVPYEVYASQVNKAKSWAAIALLCAAALIGVLVLASTEVASLRKHNAQTQAKFEALRQVVINGE